MWSRSAVGLQGCTLIYLLVFSIPVIRTSADIPPTILGKQHVVQSTDDTADDGGDGDKWWTRLKNMRKRDKLKSVSFANHHVITNNFMASSYYISSW